MDKITESIFPKFQMGVLEIISEIRRQERVAAKYFIRKCIARNFHLSDAEWIQLDFYSQYTRNPKVINALKKHFG